MLTIVTPLNLYRYDLEIPPSSWNSLHHCMHTEYANIDNWGPKNTEAFYFLFDNLETASYLGNFVANKKKKDRYWITHANTNTTLDILDFSECKSLHDFLNIIDFHQIDIYNSAIQMNKVDNITIKSLENHIPDTRIFPECDPLIEVAWFGQLLTDYQNGKIFKELISISNLEIDGYRWKENQDDTLTYCLFEHDKLDKPHHRQIPIQARA